MKDERGAVSVNEFKRIIMAFGLTRGEDGFDEDEVAKLGDQYAAAKLSYTAWEMALSGKIALDCRDGEAVFYLLEPAESSERARAIADAAR